MSEEVDPDNGRLRTALLPLALSIGLAMTGSGMLLPVLARRVDSLGGGIEILGLLTAAFALAQLLAAPFLGTLADRIGRRPILLAGLGAASLAPLGYLAAPATGFLIALRALEGGLEAGLVPAAMAAVASLVPPERRARWVGRVMAGLGSGLVVGPALGGWLYDVAGFAGTCLAASAAGCVALILAILRVPETLSPETAVPEGSPEAASSVSSASAETGLLAALPRPLSRFALLLGIDFVLTFAYGFSEPQMILYVYEDLGWSGSRFGLLAGLYGLAMVAGQAGLGSWSDRVGRKPVLLGGAILFATLFPALAFFRDLLPLLLAAAAAGLGNALVIPAVGAFYLDITPEEHRSRILGLKRAASSLGAVTGPLLVAAVAHLLGSRGVFLAAGGAVAAVTLLAAILLCEPARRPGLRREIEEECHDLRALAAQSTLRGLILHAGTRGGRGAGGAKESADTVRKPEP